MRRAAALGLLAAALAACDPLTGQFRLSGEVDVAPELRAAAPRDNAVLFVVAENAGGVPVAVRRIVNPEFPAPFEMGPEDLLMPAVRRRASLRVHAELNARGDVGRPRPGDLTGQAPGILRIGAAGVRIVLDRRR
ncbi:MAG: hypothetical protein HY552_06430 [Elusimicrobia bacterium]|nr:hypothetical protein [Elusimicrobiota bacterium]